MPIAVTLTILDSTDIISIKTIASKIMQYVFSIHDTLPSNIIMLSS